MRQWTLGEIRGHGVIRLASILVVVGVLVEWGSTRSCRAAEPAPKLRILVDARDLPRRLLHSRITIPCQPGKLALWFPKWVHGTHEPCGPVQNIAGLKLHGPGSALIPWRRDELELYRFLCEVPAGATQIEAELDVICNEPAVQAAGYLSYGNKRVGMINWSNCLLYPEGFSCDDIQAELSVELPADWLWASALKAQTARSNRGMMMPFSRPWPAWSHVDFEPLSLTELVDRPLVGGVNCRSIPLETGSGPPAFLDVVSDSPAALDVNPKVVSLYSRVVQQAQSLFGACHYPEFHFLIVCSDELGYFGLEHLTSSINGLHERDLVDEGRLKGWVANLIPHEYAHSWCGKFRRPVGMCTPDFQTPQKTAMLWVYEGLGEYLGELLMVRSGLITPAEYRRTLAATIGGLSHREGRRWRSLEDTAISSAMLRARSPNWDELRRDQDYYFEGMLVWLEADAVIREKSKGKKSLDDFCLAFFGPHSTTANVAPYDEAEITRLLHGLADFDWEGFIARRVHHPQDALPLDVVTRLGYRASYTSEPFAHPISRGLRGGGDAMDSLGAVFDVDGRVLNLVPGSIADRAKIGFTTKVVGINGKTFDDQRLQNALKDSLATHKIELLIVDDDEFKTIVLDYGDGPRHFDLVRDPGRPDLLAQIAKPRATEPEKTAQKPPLPPPKGYLCARALGPIKVDGNLDDESWKDAPWTDSFVDIEGDVRPRPRFRTRAKMLWDDRFFYVAAQIDDPHVWGTLTKHDSVIFHDNDFEIFIDPDGDNHEYYEMEINALNTEWDLFLKKPYRDGGPVQNEWEIPGLLTGVQVHGTLNNALDLDTGWTVEFAIPWKILGEFAHRPSPPRDGDQWRVNFSRVEWRHMIKEGRYEKVPNTPEANWVWSPQGVIDMHRPERWGFVQFSILPAGREGAVFKLDPSIPIRDQLMEIYYAQRAFHDKNKRWATTIDELKTPKRLPVDLRLTKGGYRAEIKFTPADAPASILSIEQDSRIQSRHANSPDSTSQPSPK